VTRVIPAIPAIRAAIDAHRQKSAVIGLVPTMGALHAGHGRLIEEARAACDLLVVSIFVNPIQFDRPDDYERYPRPIESDVAFCEARGVDFVFAPAASEMYPSPPLTYVEVTRVSEHLCGAFRPGHFRGVATVVLKLFAIVQPDRAYFGAKDAQQLAVIRRMVRDLNLPVTITEVATVREPDGLALSSRNEHLNAAERRVAPILFQALQAAARRINDGIACADKVRAEALAVLASRPEARVEYLEIVDAEEMQPVSRIAAPVRVAGAIWLGNTRLIDNVLCVPAACSESGRHESQP